MLRTFSRGFIVVLGATSVAGCPASGEDIAPEITTSAPQHTTGGPEPGGMTDVPTTGGDSSSSGGEPMGSTGAGPGTTSGETTGEATGETTGETTAEPVECGNGVIERGEDCDDRGESPTCDDDCTPVECGDGTINAAAREDCEGQSATCDDDCTLVKCGDGTINMAAGESCEPALPGVDDSCLECSATLSVVTGYHQACAIDKDGALRCWGNGFYGGLGYGKTENLGDGPGELPTPVVDVGGKVVQLSLGTQHTCARLDSGKMRCWGHGDHGRLGNGTTNTLGDQPGELPTPDIDVGGVVLQVGVGAEHSCALLAGGTMRCWGNGAYGRLGYGNTTTLLKPSGEDVFGVTDVKQIAVGAFHTCALRTDGGVQCWGNNDFGQLGIESNTQIGDNLGEVPAALSKVGDANDPVVQLSAGFYHNCALLESGKVRCWGENKDGETGVGFPSMSVGGAPGQMPPPVVDLGGPATQVLAGLGYSCALMKSKAVKCWGRAPQHGHANSASIDAVNEFPPQDLMLGGPVARMQGHMGTFTCVVLVDVTVRCWGENVSGQLGYGNTNTIGDNESPGSAGPVPL